MNLEGNDVFGGPGDQALQTHHFLPNSLASLLVLLQLKPTSFIAVLVLQI